MSNASDGPQPVAGWIRALAWVLVVGSLLGLLGAGSELVNRGFAGVPWRRVAPFVLLGVWIMPLIFIVAWRRRAPRRWPGLGTALWRSR
jgi:hypothetical protein